MVKVATERTTRQKRAIRSAFESEGRPLSTTEAFEAAQTTIGGLGIATVYRSIRALLDDGWLIPIDVPGKGVLYELAGKEHHHHFSCTTCHRVYELDGCASDVAVPLPRGFSASGHDVTIFGRCASCASDRKAAVRKKAVVRKAPAKEPAAKRR
ncbi:MAG: transcriptional repressor [Vulcanimicrobiaceae bacterium]